MYILWKGPEDTSICKDNGNTPRMDSNNGSVRNRWSERFLMCYHPHVPKQASQSSPEESRSISIVLLRGSFVCFFLSVLMWNTIGSVRRMFYFENCSHSVQYVASVCCTTYNVLHIRYRKQINQDILKPFFKYSACVLFEFHHLILMNIKLQHFNVFIREKLQFFKCFDKAQIRYHKNKS